VNKTRLVGAICLIAIAATAGAQDAKSTTAVTGDIGYVSASGNTRLTTLSVGEKIAHTDGRWVLTQFAAYVLGQANGKQTANQFRLGARADYDFVHRLGAFAGVANERNTFAGFKSRTDEIVGLRWQAIVAPADAMSLDAGGVLTQQSNVDGTSQSDPSARVAASYKHLFSKAAYFQQSVEFVPNLKTGGAYRMNSESALVAPVSAHVGVKMNFTVRYDSRPPATFRSTDKVLTMGVQIAY